MDVSVHMARSAAVADIVRSLAGGEQGPAAVAEKAHMVRKRDRSKFRGEDGRRRKGDTISNALAFGRHMWQILGYHHCMALQITHVKGRTWYMPKLGRPHLLHAEAWPTAPVTCRS